MKQREAILVRGFVVGSLLLATALALTLLIMKPSIRRLAAFLGISVITILTWSAATYLYRKKLRMEWLLSVAVLTWIVAIPELVLRTVDFRFDSGIEFGYPRPRHFVSLDPDELLFWKLRSTNADANSLGFPGAEIAVPKPKDRFRIVFLGDSVTYQGYPDLVERLLNATYPDSPRVFESVVLAVTGYSSHQGRVLAELYGQQFDPDLVFVYFGWNDHWLAYGSVDAEKKVKASKTGWSSIGDFAYHNSRILQGANRILVAITGSQDAPIGNVRVPQDHYEKNLRRIEEVFHEDGVPVIFITAPTSHYSLGVPDYLVEQSFVPDKETSVRMHKEYNQIVREVAQARGQYLLDLEGEFSLLRADDLEALFLEDGIHLTDYGLESVARQIVEFIEVNFLLKEQLQSSLIWPHQLVFDNVIIRQHKSCDRLRSTCPPV